MLPTIALVGRPNVGKSTLFNKLTHSRDALVADVPGLTRDRRYGRMEMLESQVTLIDTGGLFGEHVLADELTGQTQLAVDEADLVLLLLDGRDGVTASDEEVVTYLRKSMDLSLDADQGCLIISSRLMEMRPNEIEFQSNWK